MRGALNEPSGLAVTGSGAVMGPSEICETYGIGKRRCCAACDGREEFKWPMFSADSDSELTLGKRLNWGVENCIGAKGSRICGSQYEVVAGIADEHVMLQDRRPSVP